MPELKAFSGYSSSLWVSQGRDFKQLFLAHSQGQREVNSFICTCSLAYTQCNLSTLMQFRIPCLGKGAAHIGMSLPTSTNFEQFLIDMSIGQLNADNPSLRALFPGASRLY